MRGFIFYCSRRTRHPMQWALVKCSTQGVKYASQLMSECLLFHGRARKKQEDAGSISDVLNELNSDWGYVNVRPDAFTFWWLFESTHPDGFATRPLVMWLQGGPGASSTGYGVFQIIGPLGLDGEKRQHTWLSEVNLLFVDNPVGAGYSYVTNETAYATNTDEIAQDLLTFYTEFLNTYETFRHVPFYIFGQSYGGKMAAVFAKLLHQEITNGNVEADLTGFAMGNAWISPLDYVKTWGPLLNQMSIIDDEGLNRIQDKVDICVKSAKDDDWVKASLDWREVQLSVLEESNDVDFYNIMQYMPDYNKKRDVNFYGGVPFLPSSTFAALQSFMRGPVHEYLGLDNHVLWGDQSMNVFHGNEDDFMRPVIHVVDHMLNTTDVQVIIYSGQLDLICDTKGTMNWVKKLKWPDIEDYNRAERIACEDPVTGETEMFVKSHGQFKFYWMLNAGHAVPKDNPAPALRMLQRIITNTDGSSSQQYSMPAIVDDW